jgi:hypothetical protein
LALMGDYREILVFCLVDKERRWAYNEDARRVCATERALALRAI